MNGWYLTDSGINLQKFRIPDGTVIAANGYVVFNQYNDFGKAGDPNGFYLSELGSQVFLSTVGYTDSVGFGATDRYETLGRYTTSTGEVDFVNIDAHSEPVL